MPEIEGTHVLDMIRKWETDNLGKRKPVSVVMATAKTDTATIIDSYDRGCRYFIKKPCLKSELDELMNAMEL